MPFEKFKLPSSFYEDLFFHLRNLYVFPDSSKTHGILARKTDDGLVPLVRSSRACPRPAQMFPPFIYPLIDAIRESSRRPYLDFNNALVEISTAETGTLSRSNAALDLNPDSFMCTVVAYRYKNHSSRYIFSYGEKPDSNNIESSTTQFFLDHGSFVLCSYETNAKFLYNRTIEPTTRRVYGDQMVCLTLRLSETFIDYSSGIPRFWPTNVPLVKCTNMEYYQFLKMRLAEISSSDFEYPPIEYTVSSGDLIPPINSSEIENKLDPANILLINAPPEYFGTQTTLMRMKISSIGERSVYFFSEQATINFKRICDTNLLADACSGGTCERCVHSRIYYDVNESVRKRMPISVRGSSSDDAIAVLFDDLFDGCGDMFAQVSGAHSFYRMFSYGRELFEQTGVLCSHVDVFNDKSVLYNLLRTSAGYGGPTESFSVVDVEVLKRLDDCARQVFNNQNISFNHVQLQMSDYLLTRTSGKYHSTKTQDIKTNDDDCEKLYLTSAIAVCSFYDTEDLKRVIEKTGNLIHNGASIFPKLVFVRKEFAPTHLSARVEVLLTPNSTILIPLATNRFYARRVEIPDVPPSLRIKRLSFTATFSMQLALFDVATEKTYSMTSADELSIASPETMGIFKELHRLENAAVTWVSYEPVKAETCNKGDLMRPRIV